MRDEIKKVNDRGMEVCKPFVFPATGVEVNIEEIAESSDGFIFMENKKGKNFMMPTVNVFDPAIKTAYGIGIENVSDEMIEHVAIACASKFASIMTNNVVLVANNGLFPFFATYVVEEKAHELVDIYHNYIENGFIIVPEMALYNLFKEPFNYAVGNDPKPIRSNAYITPKSGEDAVYNKFTSAMSKTVYRVSDIYNDIITKIISGLVVDFTAITNDAMKADNIDRKNLAVTADQAYASAIINEIATRDIDKIKEITYYNIVQIYSEYFNLIGFPGYFLDSTKTTN